MIKKYVYGEPFETEALTEKIETAEGRPEYGEICTDNGFSFTYITKVFIINMIVI